MRESKKYRLGGRRQKLRREEMSLSGGDSNKKSGEVVEQIKFTPENEDLFVTVKDCLKCPEDSACSNTQLSSKNETLCVCYHFKPPTPILKGSSCPRKTVGTSYKDGFQESHNNVTGPIHVQVPGSGDTTLNPTTSSFPYTLVASLLVSSIISIILITICLIKRRKLHRILNKSSKNKMEMMDINQGNGLLLLPTDRFVSNPTYESPCLDLAIRVFSQEEVNLSIQIGQGCFGKVFKGAIDGVAVAIKVVKKEYSEEAMKEVETMATFSHSNILHLIGIVQSSDFDAPWLIFEFMQHGDLAGVLRNGDNKDVSPALQSNLTPATPTLKENDAIGGEMDKKLQLTNESLLNFASQISEGMKYLSSQHFVHRDLAARNCLVSESGMVKISDFGLSRDVYTCDYYKIGGPRLLPLRWMAPESILYGRFTLESDVWAYGVLLWEIFSWGKQPYFGHSNEEVVQLILDGVLLCPPSDCPPIICRIMEGCWKTEPKDRLKFHHITQRFSIKYSRKESGGNLGEKTENFENMVDNFPQSSPFGKSFPRPSVEAWINSGYEIPRSILEKDYLKVV